MDTERKTQDLSARDKDVVPSGISKGWINGMNGTLFAGAMLRLARELGVDVGMIEGLRGSWRRLK